MFKTYKKRTKKYDFSQIFVERITRFLWAKNKWAMHSEKTSNLLIYHEQPEQIAHGRSFVVSDLRDLLTVAHLIWAILANERMSDEQMSEFPTL